MKQAQRKQPVVSVDNAPGEVIIRASLGGGYDILLANIVADVIIALAPFVRSLLRPGGLFLCSGIIDTRAGEVAEAIRQSGLTLLEQQEADGWCAYTCR